MPVVELAIVETAAGRGLFHAMHGELVLVEKTAEPVYAGARELLTLGIAKPKTVVRVRHRGEIVMAAECGRLAKYTLDWTGPKPRKVLWQPTAAAA